MILVDAQGMRFNPAGVVVHNGVTYNGTVLMHPSVCDALGITEVEEPSPPEGYDPALWDRTEIAEHPYVVYSQKPAEQLFAESAKRYERALDDHLDAVARENRYNNRITFALRAGYVGPYQAEGVAFAQWMDAAYADAYALLQEVQSGQAEAPTIEAFIASIPAFVKP